MNSKLTNMVDKNGGWFSRQDALACGYSDAEIRLRVRTGRWGRLCRGAYAETDPADAAKPSWERRRERHARAARAIHDRLGGRAAISHQSAIVLHGLPTWGLDLNRVHVTRLSGAGRADDDVYHHGCRLTADDLTDLDGVRLTTVARAVVDAACLSGYQSAVSVADAALRQRQATPGGLAAAVAAIHGRRGAGRAVGAIAFADGRSESVGESRLRVLMADNGLPAPLLQASIAAPDGTVVGRVDFLFEELGVVVEFDGAMKYRGHNGSEVVVAEKWREDRIRELGYVVIRVSWADLERPRLTVQRIRAALARAGAR